MHSHPLLSISIHSDQLSSTLTYWYPFLPKINPHLSRFRLTITDSWLKQAKYYLIPSIFLLKLAFTLTHSHPILATLTLSHALATKPVNTYPLKPVVPKSAYTHPL